MSSSDAAAAAAAVALPSPAPAAALPSPQSLPVVSRDAAEFRELGPLGAGAFSRVVRAAHRLDGREYAVKKSTQELFSPADVARWRQEAQALAAAGTHRGERRTEFFFSLVLVRGAYGIFKRKTHLVSHILPLFLLPKNTTTGIVRYYGAWAERGPRGTCLFVRVCVCVNEGRRTIIIERGFLSTSGSRKTLQKNKNKKTPQAGSSCTSSWRGAAPP
jgi:serine/threonine protein kinase